MRVINFYLIIGTISCCFLLIYSCSNADKKQSSSTNSSSGKSVQETITKYQYYLHPAMGRKYYYTINSETQTKLEVNDKKIEMVNKSDMGLVYEVIKDSSTNFVLKLSYNRLRMVIQKSDEEDKVIDADTPPNGRTMIENLLSSIKGSSVFLTIDTKGNITNVSGNKEISDKILAMAEPGVPKQLVQQLLNKFTGDGFIKDNIKDGFALFPDTTLFIGSSWNRKNTQAGEISFETNAKYTLASISDNIAEIETEGQISSAKNNISNIMGQQVTTDLTGEQNGKYKTDITTGMLILGKTNTSVKGTIQVQGREVPISIKLKKEIVLKQ